MKTVEAWLRGYFLFAVNGERFYLYHRALAQWRRESGNDVSMVGWHIWKGWRTFYLRSAALPTGFRYDDYKADAEL